MSDTSEAKAQAEYGRFSIGLAAASLAFTVATYRDILDYFWRGAAVLAVILLGASILVGFLLISAIDMSTGDETDKNRKERQNTIHGYGRWHLGLLALGITCVSVLVVADILMALPRESSPIEIECLEAILRGWPVCAGMPN